MGQNARKGAAALNIIAFKLIHGEMSTKTHNK
jgi:hypothetical protein